MAELKPIDTNQQYATVFFFDGAEWKSVVRP